MFPIRKHTKKKHLMGVLPLTKKKHLRGRKTNPAELRCTSSASLRKTSLPQRQLRCGNVRYRFRHWPLKAIFVYVRCPKFLYMSGMILNVKHFPLNKHIYIYSIYRNMLKFYNAKKYIDGTNWNLESMGDTSSNYHPAAFLGVTISIIHFSV